MGGFSAFREMHKKPCIACGRPTEIGKFCYHDPPIPPPPPPPRLYRVTQEREFYMMAEDPETARILARNVDENDTESETYVQEVVDKKYIDKDWLRSIAYSEDGPDETIEEWFDRQGPPQEPPKDDPHQLRLF